MVPLKVRSANELQTKTESGERIIDIDIRVCQRLVREHPGDRKAGRLFEARHGSPISDGNIRRRVLQPILEKLGIYRREVAEKWDQNSLLDPMDPSCMLKQRLQVREKNGAP